MEHLHLLHQDDETAAVQVADTRNEYFLYLLSHEKTLVAWRAFISHRTLGFAGKATGTLATVLIDVVAHSLFIAAQRLLLVMTQPSSFMGITHDSQET